MQCKLSLLLAICALATALAKDKRPLGVESDSDESGEQNTHDTTTVKPESNIIFIKNSTDLETQIAGAGDKLVIIYFMVTWCPHCKKINPTVEDIAAKTNNLVVLMVDRDNLEDDHEVWKYGLSNLPSVPRFIFVKNGKKIEEIHGSNCDLRGTVSKFMSPSKSSSESSDSSNLLDE
ncbi:thioredoxin-2-like [Cydia pomonella]|uniref:thioredoxin-2-like n=1 Tax=Cydia pomonella TaxID=82600 RepID=UPI002ADE379C|nr:thioredoxin-2-like [Cydia pomonella]